MTYSARIKTHLADYKREVLNIDTSGQWRGKEYAHILPHEHKNLNILEAIRTDLIKYIRSQPELELHPNFAHLNSSQAACFNLFFPLLTKESWCLPKDLLPIDISSIDHWNFEYVADTEERTNFDLFVKNNRGQELFLEFKLSENEFGTAKQDSEHLNKLAKIYEPKLRGKIRPEFLDPELFFQHYQLLRNISYADAVSPAYIVFLLPKENQSLAPPISKILDALTPEIAPQVTVSYLEDFIESLLSSDSNSDMSSYFNDYAQKYLPSSS